MIDHDCLPIVMLLYVMLYIVIAYSMLLAVYPMLFVCIMLLFLPFIYIYIYINNIYIEIYFYVYI